MLIKKSFLLVAIAFNASLCVCSSPKEQLISNVTQLTTGANTQAQINNQESTEDFVCSYIDALTSQNIVPKEKITYQDGKLILFSDPKKTETICLGILSLGAFGFGAFFAYCMQHEDLKREPALRIFAGIGSALYIAGGLVLSKMTIDRIHRMLNSVPFIIFEDNGITLCDQNKKVLWKDVSKYYPIDIIDAINGTIVRTTFNFIDKYGNVILSFCSNIFSALPRDSMLNIIEFFWKRVHKA